MKANPSSGDPTASLAFPGQVEAAFRNRKLIHWLARWRARSGFSQAEVARRMQTSQPAVARLESHQHDPQLSTLTRYAGALKLSIDFVVSDSQTDAQIWRSNEDLEARGNRELPAPNQVVESERSHPTAGSFWEALEPEEREALRAVAFSRVFAAGSRIMAEGERADHVMVILGGRVKICVEENGWERILAERGLGQLLGERAALQVSVRSATVIALETVQALVVQTKDFAAFLTVHPRVLTIVQNQIYQPRTEDLAEAGRDHVPDVSVTGTADSADASGQPERGLTARYLRGGSRPLVGENCTVLMTDVVQFGDHRRTDADRLLIREALVRMTQAALKDMADVRLEDRGDGFLTVVPPTIPTANVMDRLFNELLVALQMHNSTQRESARFKLRVAVNVGPVVSDSMGVSGEAVIIAARMVEAQDLKKAMAGSTASLGLIASPFVYETVIRHSSNPSDLANYSQVRVHGKDFDPTAWMRLFDVPVTDTQLSVQSARRKEALVTAIERRDSN